MSISSVQLVVLTHIFVQMVGTEFEIDSDQKTLEFYSIEDGDQVLVRW